MSESNQITINKSTIYTLIFALVGVVTLIAAISIFIFSKNSETGVEEKPAMMTNSEVLEESALEVAEKDIREDTSEESSMITVSEETQLSGTNIPKGVDEDNYVSAGTGGYVDESDNVDPTTGEPIYWNKGKRVDLNNYSGSVKDAKGNKFYYVNGDKVSKHDWNLITNGYQDEPPAGTKFIQYDDMPADIQAELDELNESAVYQ